MKITLKDGSVKEYSEAKSVYDIAADISEGLARVACAGEVDGEVVDLRTVLDKDCNLNIITASDEEGLKVIRHTASHVLAQAVKKLFPDAKITIGPAIEDGFYYDFDHAPFSREDLDNLEAEMKKIIKEGHELKRFTLPREEAIKFMQERNEPYKVELIEELPVEDKSTSTYENIQNSLKILDELGMSHDMTIVTDGFHQYRASLIAKAQGVENVTAYSAYTEPRYLFTYWVREWLGLTHFFMLGS